MKLHTITEWTTTTHILKTWQQQTPQQLRRSLQQAIDELDRLGNGPEYYEHLDELATIAQHLTNHPQKQAFDDELLMINTLTQELPQQTTQSIKQT